MSVMMKSLIIIIILPLWNGIAAGEYTIERRVYEVKDNNYNYWEVQPDRFIIPSSVCSSDGSVQCTTMGGINFKDCECECSEENNTFGFYNTQWKCAENKQVHKGCLIMLHDIDSMIITVPRGKTEYYYLPTLNGSARCSVTKGSSLMCTGNWKQLRNNLVRRKFALYQDGDNLYLNNKWNLNIIEGQVIRIELACIRPNSTNCVILKVQGTTKCPIPPTQSPPTTTVPTTTVPTTTVPTTTVPTTTVPTTTVPITKVPTTLERTTTAETPQPSPMTIMTTTTKAATKTPPPPPPPTTTTTTTLTTLTTARHQTSSRGLQTRPSITTGVISTVAQNNNFSAGNENVSGTKDAGSIATTSSVFEKKHNKSPSKENNNSGLIAGSLAGVIGLAILIAIIVVMRRRKERKCNAKTKDTVENAGYEKGVDNSLRITERGQQAHDEDEYAYAYTRNAVPFENTNKQDTGDHSYNNQGLEPKSFVANHFYGTTEALQDSPPHLKAPINNTLEEPEYARPKKSKKVHQSSSDAPIHNTLEEPEYARPNKSRKVHQTCADAPSHNTLEELGYARPNKSRKVHQTCADAPIYNTLEEPEYGKVNKGGNTKLPENKNEPLYNVLEGPDAEHDEEQSEEPPCYHVLEGPFPDGAPVYDVLEGPEPGEAPVYGTLDGPDPHVYGTLDMCDTEGAFKDNREYNDIVYDSVGEVVNDTGDIYQQLNQSGQGGSDVYQGLSYPDKTMYLKELTESHSNV